MHRQHPGKRALPGRERVQCAPAEPRALIHHQQQVGHERGPPAQPAVFLRVSSQASGPAIGVQFGIEAARQRTSLVECQAQAFTRDGVHGAGGIAHQGDAVGADPPQLARSGHRAPLQARRFGSMQAPGKFRKHRQGLIQP